MRLEINNLKQPVRDFPFDNDADMVRFLVAEKLRIREMDISELRILRRSVDARNKKDILLVYSAEAEINENINPSRYIRAKDVVRVNERMEYEEEGKLVYGSRPINNRPIIIGSGPAGLFAGLVLAQHGYSPLILERGSDVDKRAEAVNTFFRQGVLDEESNIQFGEGGAGTFSDGKLTTRIKDRRIGKVLNTFVEEGAPREILYQAKPHIGTDILKTVIKNMRKRIVELGGEVRFLSKVTDILAEEGRAKAVIINGKSAIESNVIIAALGHSARDTYSMLL
ncbi:MAG TPA: FAD-dependent monooxygenase, partial [Candidatus Diapherotrites archaeon]|nr:FAD-dependent monooxygenase [Candidatus Diapherotrites archaeon]